MLGQYRLDAAGATLAAGVRPVSALFLANNAEELRQQLGSIAIPVRPIGEGRRGDAPEKRSLAHLLSALHSAGRLAYPLAVCKRERPDFLLQANGINIGVEHTEAVPQNDARKTALINRTMGGQAAYLIPHRRPGEPEKSTEELMGELAPRFASPPWCGDSAERLWAEAMLHFVKRKVATSSKNGFERFTRNWLLIYDNWPLPNPDRSMAAELLFQLVRATTCFRNFDLVYVVSADETQVFEFSDAQSKAYAVKLYTSYGVANARSGQ